MKMTEFIQTIQNILNGVGNYFHAKLIPAFIIPMIGMFFGFDDNMALVGMIILIGFDFVTGVIAAYHNNEFITSKGVRRSASKVAVYGILISAGHITEQITPGTWYIQDAVITFLALTELISIIENVGKMGYAIPKKLLKKLEWIRDQETSIKEKIVTKETTDPVTNITEKHTIQETKVETHISEKPKE